MPEEFYKGNDYTTLQMLEDRCETDESDHTAKLTALEIVTQAGDFGTLGTYESVPLADFEYGLIFDDYKNEAEANLKETNYELHGAKKMFRGRAKIGDKNLKVTVLREKQP